MLNRNKWIFALTAVLLAASACNLFSLINPVDQAASQAEKLAEEVDIDKIESEIETLATELPDEIPEVGDLDDLGDLSNLEETAQAFQEGFESGDLPEDIPLVDQIAEMIFSSQELVSYATPLAFADVLAFYQENMPANGWEPQEEGSMVVGEAALLPYSKTDQEALVTLSVNPQDGSTVVLITIQPK